jgi:uncharacterized membrane protein
MPTTFGMSWGSEGVGVAWPGQDAAILAILACVLASALISARLLHRRGRTVMEAITRFLAFRYDFIVGDD